MGAISEMSSADTISEWGREAGKRLAKNVGRAKKWFLSRRNWSFFVLFWSKMKQNSLLKWERHSRTRNLFSTFRRMLTWLAFTILYTNSSRFTRNNLLTLTRKIKNKVKLRYPLDVLSPLFGFSAIYLRYITVFFRYVLGGVLQRREAPRLVSWIENRSNIPSRREVYNSSRYYICGGEPTALYSRKTKPTRYI